LNESRIPTNEDDILSELKQIRLIHKLESKLLAYLNTTFATLRPSEQMLGCAYFYSKFCKDKSSNLGHFQNLLEIEGELQEVIEHRENNKTLDNVTFLNYYEQEFRTFTGTYNISPIKNCASFQGQKRGIENNLSSFATSTVKRHKIQSCIETTNTNITYVMAMPSTTKLLT
jgi:hypothetical protein